MAFQRKIQGSLAQLFSQDDYRDFSEEQLQAYFTKDDTVKRGLMALAFSISIASFFAGFFFLVHFLLFVLVSGVTLMIGAGIRLEIMRIKVPTDKQFEAWVAKKAQEELQEGLKEVDLAELPECDTDRILCVRGYAVPGTKDEKRYLKDDILWKDGKDGKKHYSINTYTYVIPLPYRFAALSFHVNAVNHRDRSRDVGEHFYSDVVSVRSIAERELVEIAGMDCLYSTQTFTLGTNDGKGISVTICSLPVTHQPDLPEFDFIDDRVEETIRRIRKFVRSIKQQAAYRD